ncbi:MAG: hypothetical protein HQK51_09460 [Oligoflexia bacterium]|nr:hypothetical protein [Oligoflexia bacterium]
MFFFKILKTLVLVTLLTVNIAYAGEGTGFIKAFGANYGGENRDAGSYYVTFESRSGQPTCATTNSFYTNDKALMAVLLSAKMANKMVKVTGTDKCSIHGSYETLWAVQILD